MIIKTENKRIPTKEEGVFYKRIINEKDKEIDKIYIIRYRDNGKDKLKTVGKSSQGIRVNYCKQLRNEILNKLRLGEQPPLIAQNKKKIVTTLDDFAKIYFLEKESYVKDIDKIKRSYEIHIKPYIGGHNVERISTEDLKKLQNLKRQSLAERTVNALLQIIGAIFNLAIKKKLFNKSNPLNDDIKRIKTDNKRERYLELEEIRNLLEKTKEKLNLHIFTQLALQTGGRLSTILSITKKDIKFETNSLVLKDHKNNSTYTAFYNNELKSLLQHQIQHLNLNDKIVKMHKQSVQDQLTKIGVVT